MKQGLFLEPRVSLRQEVESTLALSPELADPVAYARDLFVLAKKASVPVKIGDYTILVRAALVSEKQLGTLFEGEQFGGIVARLDERYQFFNREIRSPPEFGGRMPELIAFHCLASVSVRGFGDESGTLRQYQATALELAYAKRMMGAGEYARYESWRATIERTDFFRRDDWRLIAEHAHANLPGMSGGVAANAKALDFHVMSRSTTFFAMGNTAVAPDGSEVKLYRKAKLTRS